MVEEVKYKEKPIIKNKDRKSLIIGFYVWNLNLYITSLLSFSQWYIIAFFIYLINIFCFRTLFGRFQNLKTIFLYHIIIVFIYIYNFDLFNWRMILIIITTLINIAYYLSIIENEKRIKKAVNRN